MREVTVELDFSVNPLKPIRLSTAQAAALNTKASALLITGDAGTGKSETLEAFIKKAIEDDQISPEEILYFAFSRHHARKVRERLAERIEAAALPRVTTFYSFAYGVVQQVINQDPELSVFENLKLLSAPEQVVRLNELLTNAINDKSINWPEEFKAAVGTFSFTQQVRNLIARIRSLGMDPVDLTKLGQLHDNPLWIELGKFIEIYLDVLDAQNLIDYTEVAHRASLYLAQGKFKPSVTPLPRLVVVDEYQDIDFSQIRILKALAHLGTRVVCAADPTLSIYQFRGTDTEAVNRFQDDFKNSERINLLTNYRQTDDFQEVSQAFENKQIQYLHLVSQIRQLRKTKNLAWSDIAVIGRGTETLSQIYRELLRAQIPAELTEIENPVYQDAAVKAVIDVVELALTDKLTADQDLVPEIARVLHSPVMEYSKSELRKTVGEIRELAAKNHQTVPTTTEAIFQAYLNPTLLLELSPHAWGLRKLSALVLTVQKLVAQNASIYQVLWQVFSDLIDKEFQEQFQLEFNYGSWRENLYQSAIKSNQESYAANRSLDSLMALFDMASREDEALGNKRDIKGFIQELKLQAFAQETIVRKAQRSQVQLLTAHSAKAQQWRAVFVVDLQEGVWPSDRLRNTLLEVERITPAGYGRKFARHDLLLEERNLFNVARSRASEILYLSCIKNDFEDKANPSQFIYELIDDQNLTKISYYPDKFMSLNDLVVQLRQALISDDSSEEFKKAVALRVKKLSEAKDGYENLIAPNLAPENWWGMSKPEPSLTPVRKLEEPVKISASQIKSISECALKWFLDNDGGAKLITSHQMSVGSVIHALAHALVKNEVSTDIKELTTYVEKIWPRIEFEANWIALKEKSSVSDMLSALVKWHQKDRNRKVAAVEQKIDYDHNFDDLNDSVHISGRIDRIEEDPQDPTQLYLVDFKTSKNAPSGPEVKVDSQLAAYRLATDNGALNEDLNREAKSAGAELVELRDTKKGEAKVLTSSAVEETPILEQLRTALKIVRTEDFSAQICQSCRMCAYRKICPAQEEGQSVL